MQTPTIEVSKCCQADVEYVYDDKNDGYICRKCFKTCEVEDVCELCYGTGETTEMEQVYANEPHMAPIGTRKCVCQIKEDDE
jgi:hypothetical protein